MAFAIILTVMPRSQTLCWYGFCYHIDRHHHYYFHDVCHHDNFLDCNDKDANGDDGDDDKYVTMMTTTKTTTTTKQPYRRW